MRLLAITFFTLFITGVQAQERVSPAISGFGAIFEIPEAEERPDPDIDYKIVIDLKSGVSSPEQMNPALLNIARLFNLHAVGGVSKEKINVVGVFHNRATQTVISNEAYQEKYGVDNPNLELIKALKAAGVRLFVCGQSMKARGYAFEDLNPDIKVSISALTIFTSYQMNGFKLLQF